MDRDFKKSKRDEHIVDLLSSYIDNALNPDERESVRAHLVGCDSCRIELDSLNRTKVMLKSLPVVPPPRAFTLTPEMVGAGARQESFWQRLLTPRAVPRFATGSVVAFALLIFLLVGDFAAVNRNMAASPYATTGGTASEESARNSNVTMKAGPTTAAEAGVALAPPAADTTATTGAAMTGQGIDGMSGYNAGNEPTPDTLKSAFEPGASATVSAQDAFLESLSARPATIDEAGTADGPGALLYFQIALATVGTLLAIGAFVARRRGV